jgi:hypothetical protein
MQRVKASELVVQDSGSTRNCSHHEFFPTMVQWTDATFPRIGTKRQFDTVPNANTI